MGEQEVANVVSLKMKNARKSTKYRNSPQNYQGDLNTREKTSGNLNPNAQAQSFGRHDDPEFVLRTTYACGL